LQALIFFFNSKKRGMATQSQHLPAMLELETWRDQ